MTTDTEAPRAQFEREFGKSPYEWNLSRFPEKSAWAGQYTELKTQCGWEGYQAGHAAAKAETAAAVAKERERASVLYDMLLNRPALNAGLESEYAAWTSKCYQVTGAYKAIKRLNGVGVSAYEVARLACVSPVTIERIWRGETWRYV